MIGGTDLVLKGRTKSDDADFILRAFRRLWPDAYFQKADVEESSPMSAIRFPVVNTHEFFLYRDSDSMESWQKHGATPENEDSMAHVIVSDREATIVVDKGDGALAAMVEEIFDGLRAKRLMPRTTRSMQQVSHGL